MFKIDPMKAMTLLKIRSVSVAALAFCVALIPSVAVAQQQIAPAATSEVVLTIDPAPSKVHWILDTTLHTVHGTFALKSGTLHFDPKTGKAGGEIVVYAPSGESGNGSRDKRMHKEILETAKYPEVVFRPQQVEGSVVRSGTSDVKLSGVFSIHGVDHALTAEVHANLSRDHWTGTGKFQVPYISWGIKDPSNFLLKVKPVVNVELELSGSVKSAN